LRIQEIRNLTPEQLRKELENAQRELMNLRFRLATRQLANVSELRKVRKKIARIKTVLRELQGV
jgi:large subunit ribosomal protein L29